MSDPTNPSRPIMNWRIPGIMSSALFFIQIFLNKSLVFVIKYVSKYTDNTLSRFSQYHAETSGFPPGV